MTIQKFKGINNYKLVKSFLSLGVVALLIGTNIYLTTIPISAKAETTTTAKKSPQKTTTESEKTKEQSTEVSSGGQLDINDMVKGNLATAKGTWKNGKNTVTVNGEMVSITKSGQTTEYNMSVADRTSDGLWFWVIATLTSKDGKETHDLTFVPNKGNAINSDMLFLDLPNNSYTSGLPEEIAYKRKDSESSATSTSIGTTTTVKAGDDGGFDFEAIQRGDISSLAGVWKDHFERSSTTPPLSAEAALKAESSIEDGKLILVIPDSGPIGFYKLTYTLIPKGISYVFQDRIAGPIETDSSKDRIVETYEFPSLYTRDETATSTKTDSEATPASIEDFWNSYLDEINNSITSGHDTTAYLWAGNQPAHIREMMNDYIDAGVLQTKGNRTFTILNQDANTVTVSLNGTRTIVLQKTGDSFKIQSFNW